MAKLNGVKTLDMKNGEITKVAYNGEEYAKVDKYEGLQKGDIFLAGPHTKFLVNMDTQGYYELIGVQSDGDPIFEDDRGNVRKPGMGAVGVLYRKISASTSPTIEKRVDELESRVSALEGDKAEIIEFEGAKYRKVDREAREGDVVIFTKEQASETTDLTAGKPYLVVNHFNDDSYLSFTADDGSPYGVYCNHFKRTPETVDVYAPIANSEPKYEPKVGDIVVITGDSEVVHVENEIGDIGKITKVDNDETAKVHVAGKRNEFNYVGFEDMRPATAEEIAQYEKAVAKSKLKAGDYVVFTDAKAFDDYFTANKPYKVRAGDLGDLYIFNDEDMADYGALDDYDYEIVEGEALKWAKLGRKVNEYKKGDIISYEYKAPIRYFSVTRIDGDRVYFNSHDFGNSEEYVPKNHPSIKLVAPVESVLTQN